STGLHEHRIADGVAHAGECAAHRRGTQMQARGGTNHAVLGQDRLQDEQLIQIGCGHAVTLPRVMTCVKRTRQVRTVRLPPGHIGSYAECRAAPPCRSDAATEGIMRDERIADWAVARSDKWRL